MRKKNQNTTGLVSSAPSPAQLAIIRSWDLSQPEHRHRYPQNTTTARPVLRTSLGNAVTTVLSHGHCLAAAPSQLRRPNQAPQDPPGPQQPSRAAHRSMQDHAASPSRQHPAQVLTPTDLGCKSPLYLKNP